MTKDHSLKSALNLDLLKIVYNFSRFKKIKLYLVGGILRDWLLGKVKENPDIDFCLKKGTISFGRSLAKKLKAGFVVLDKEHGACRLVKRIKDKTYTLDFTDFRGPTLEEDLLHRDFTINALALDLEKVFSGPDLDKSLTDYYGGRVALKQKVIRLVNKNSFLEDPLRILRAFSFSSILGFKIDKKTLNLARSQRKRLSGVSYERIRDELFKIFDGEHSFDYLVMLDEAKILKVILPEIEGMRGVNQGPYHHLDVWKHTLETLKQLGLLLQEFRNKEDIQAYLNEVISSDRRRRALIKLGALLHDIGKPSSMRRLKGKLIFHGHERLGLEITERISKYLRLSNDEIGSLKKMVLWHLRPGYLADNPEVTARAKFRYFRDANAEAVSTILISLADQRATRGRLTTKDSRERHERVCKALIKEYFKKKREKKFPRLINGDDLIKKFKLQPSPLIGKILSEVEELQAIGKIKTKQQALSVAAKFIKEISEKV
jgi:poly(A) polymerase